MAPDRWQQISHIYHAALTRDPADRPAFLEEVCAGDAELRREVASLLAQKPTAEGFLAAPAAPGGTTMGAEEGRLIGRRLGAYRIDALLGMGGMGEVYRARDTKLGRDVAIKVLPAAFAANTERVHRFEHEARLLAALNHPHIAAIHGFEEGEGLSGLVLELVEGPTLADRVARGPLAIKEALTIACQMAEALEAAHEKGIVHRDLKPANIKLTADGMVKVLDFGLAKLGPEGAEKVSQVPTLTAGGTHDGGILGTAAYMSPEQARGQAVDKRSDIWAFGCVLYEMLTGRAAFVRATLSDTLAAVLEHEPDWPALPPQTAVIRRLLQRCLEKDRRERIPDIAVARIELKDALTEPATGIGTSSPAAGSTGVQRVPRWRTPAAMAVAGLALITITGAAVWNPKPVPSSSPQPVSRFTISLPPGAQFDTADADLALSLDGRRLAYVAGRRVNVAADRQIYMREMDSLETRLVAGTERARSPFFSSDSQWLGFDQDGFLKKISVTGGSAINLAAAPNRIGASWGPGRILFSPTLNSALQEVSDAGGGPKPLTRLESGETRHNLPEQGRQNIYWQLADGSGGLEQLTSGEYEQYPNSFSPDGRLLAFYEVHPATGRDVWVLRLSDRKAEPVLATTADEASPKFSPDGRWLAYVSNESGRQRGVPTAVSGPERTVADFCRRRNRARMESERSRALLWQREQYDGCGHRNAA